MTALYWTGLSATPAYAALLDAPVAPTDARYEDHMVIMGTEFFAEAYASEATRDAALGPATPHTEFVAAPCVLEASAVNAAIGPSLDDPDFHTIAAALLPIIIDTQGGTNDELPCSRSVIIARTRYHIHFSVAGNCTISWEQLCGYPDTAVQERTAMWLWGYFSASQSMAA